VSADDANESRLEQRSRAAFEASVASLDGRTRSRLNQARQQAIAVAGKRSQRWVRAFVPATGLATAALLAVILQLSPASRVQHSPEAVGLDDLDIVSDADNVDLMQDIDFYAWMPQGDATARQ
jgi:hypothetical protein